MKNYTTSMKNYKKKKLEKTSGNTKLMQEEVEKVLRGMKKNSQQKCLNGEMKR